jgi:hypothetical protein
MNADAEIIKFHKDRKHPKDITLCVACKTINKFFKWKATNGFLKWNINTPKGFKKSHKINFPKTFSSTHKDIDLVPWAWWENNTMPKGGSFDKWAKEYYGEFVPANKEFYSYGVPYTDTGEQQGMPKKYKYMMAPGTKTFTHMLPLSTLKVLTKNDDIGASPLETCTTTYPNTICSCGIHEIEWKE